MNNLTRSLVFGALACCLGASASTADWLVTRAGERIETRGGWETRGRMIVFTSASGTLSSLRLSEIDLEASAEATKQAAMAPAPAASKPQPAKRPVRVITTEDVGEGLPGATGTDLLIERLRQAHRLKDLRLAHGLVNWEGVPDDKRNAIEGQIAWMMDHRIRNIRFVAGDPEEILQLAEDNVVYEPNVEVAGNLEIDFLPDPGKAGVVVTFPVGTHLGSYYIAALREVDE